MNPPNPNSSAVAGPLGRKGRCVGMALALAAMWVAASCAPGTDGLVVTAVEPESRLEYAPAVDLVALDAIEIPVVRAPEVEAVTALDTILEDRLGAFGAATIDGIDILSVECDAGRIQTADESHPVFANVDLEDRERLSFQVDTQAGVSRFDRSSGSNRTRLLTDANGTGVLVDHDRRDRLSVVSFFDGSGEVHQQADDVTQTVSTRGDGTGDYYRRGPEGVTTIKIATDGSGELYFDGETALVTVDAEPDGSGEYYYDTGERKVTVKVRPDRSWELADRTFAQLVTLVVNPDGSGQYHERSGAVSTLDFGSDGFTEDGRQVIVPPTPVFEVDGNFPPIASLATVKAPCATVLRFDSALLFDVDRAEIKPEAARLLEMTAPGLIEAGRPIEINGHTDATGTEEYNQDLSVRRAQAVAKALADLGVNVEMTVQGFGESQPIALNYLSDGTDYPEGQAQNRRVEIVING